MSEDKSIMEWASELAYPRAQEEQLRETMLKRANEELAWYSDPEFPPTMTIDFICQGRRYRGVVHRVDEVLVKEQVE